MALGAAVLDGEFVRQRAQTVRELAEKATDPFIKQRLVNLVARYESGYIAARTPLTPIDLEFRGQGNGSEQ
jgi:hypothetical protein